MAVMCNCTIINSVPTNYYFNVENVEYIAPFRDLDSIIHFVGAESQLTVTESPEQLLKIIEDAQISNKRLKWAK